MREERREARVSLDALTWAGDGLRRPECVLATAAGEKYTADWRGGVAHLRADGGQALYAGALPDGRTPRPNGIELPATFEQYRLRRV